MDNAQAQQDQYTDTTPSDSASQETALQEHHLRSETKEEDHHASACDLGIAAVLFPSTPPTPRHARLIKGLSFQDDSKKPRGLAGAAGLLSAIWQEPDQQTHSPSDLALKAFLSRARLTD